MGKLTRVKNRAAAKLIAAAYSSADGSKFLSSLLPLRENDFEGHLAAVSYPLPTVRKETSEEPLKFTGGVPVETSENDELWKLASS